MSAYTLCFARYSIDCIRHLICCTFQLIYVNRISAVYYSAATLVIVFTTVVKAIFSKTTALPPAGVMVHTATIHNCRVAPQRPSGYCFKTFQSFAIRTLRLPVPSDTTPKLSL
ncbi:MAG: S-Ena type endospore appendage [Veillonella parvula]